MQAYLAGWSKFRVLHVQSAWTAVNRSACGDAMMHAVGVYMQLAAEVAGRCPCSDQYLSEAHASATKAAIRAFSEAAGGGAERETFRQVLEQRMQDGHRCIVPQPLPYLQEPDVRSDFGHTPGSFPRVLLSPQMILAAYCEVSSIESPEFEVMSPKRRKLAAHNEAASRRLAVELIESLYAER